MSLTTRGRGVVAIAAISFVLALLFGARSLNAVVVPAAVLLFAAYVQVSRLPEIVVQRESPGDAHVGEQRVAELSFTLSDGEPVARPFIGTVTERVPDGITLCPPEADDSAYTIERGPDVDSARFETAVGKEPLRYRVQYEQRGEQSLGQASVRATDVFGLMETEFRLRGTSSVLVYPQVHNLHSWGRESLRRLREYGRSQQREQFEELREYHPGDPLRDIHWKTTAKRDELVVKEFAAESEAEAVTLAAGADVDGADWMAEATASVALSLVDEGIPVEVTLPRGEVTIGPDHGGELALLRTLATATSGRVTTPEADITITGRSEDAVIQVADAEYAFSQLIDRTAERPETNPATEVTA